MRKLSVLVFLAVVFAGVSAAADVDLEVEENPSMVVGGSDEAVLGFAYEGDQFGRSFEPFALTLTVNHEEGDLSHEYFDASGNLSYSWASNDYSFELECVSGPEEVSSVNETGAFYETSSTVVNNSQRLCVPENTLSVLKSSTVIEDGVIELDFSTSPRVAPGEMNITYDFGGFSGFPSFDPLLEADENGTVEMEGEGIRIEDLEEGMEIGVVGYSALNVEQEVPEGQSRASSYYEFEPEEETDGELELEYSIDKSESEPPQLYRCNVVDGDCDWEQVENQSAENGILEAELAHFSIFGVFTSPREEVIVETVTETVETGDGGGSTVVTRTETETEIVNNTEVETALKPTASFDILYTSPDIRENIELNASDSYDPDGHIESYEWSFGKEGEFVETSFPENKSVNVTLTVVDSQGAKDSVTKSLNSGITSAQKSSRSGDGGRSQQNTRSLTGEFLDSTTSLTGLIAILVVAALALLVYTGRIEPAAVIERTGQKLEK